MNCLEAVDEGSFSGQERARLPGGSELLSGVALKLHSSAVSGVKHSLVAVQLLTVVACGLQPAKGGTAQKLCVLMTSHEAGKGEDQGNVGCGEGYRLL